MTEGQDHVSAAPEHPDPPIGNPNDAAADSPNLLINIINDEHESDCKFWVGFYRTGTMKPFQLLEIERVQEVFEKASTTGLDISGPIMLTDSLAQGPSYYFLSPLPQTEQEMNAEWVSKLCDSILSWNIDNIGFYFGTELMRPNASQVILSKILRKAILLRRQGKFNLLIGTHGINTIINVALDLRHHLLSEGVHVFVYH